MLSARAGLTRPFPVCPVYSATVTPLTPDRAFTTFAPTPFGIALPLLLIGVYALSMARRAARARSTTEGTGHTGALGRWPWWRPLVYVLGCAVLVWALDGGPAAYRRDYAWLGGLSVGLTAAVVPLALALGDPVRLWEDGRGRPVPWLRGRIARVLTFPLVASAVSAAVLTIAFVSQWFSQAREHDAPWNLLQFTALAIGLLVNLPLLAEDLLPAWCTPAQRTLFAFADGLADAIPGVIVLTAVDWTLGQVLVAVAEAVGVPLIIVVMMDWVRADAAEAAAVDAELDRGAVQAPVPDGTSTEGPERPWWESDPQLHHRFRGPRG